MNLYPIKFKPLFFDKIWGGNRLKTLLNKDCGDSLKCGESWELSGVEGNVSVVSNGFLAGNGLDEIIEIYMGDLVGDKVYEKFGGEFPLLIKFIDAQDDLSVQVHPNDKLAKERHNAYGKTEMWYVVDTEDGALINSGFDQALDRDKYLQYFKEGKLMDLLHFDKAKPGDVFFIPAGRVHAIGKGCMVAEIQQTSDVTYRIYDYDRKDANGKGRDLHVDLALDAIDFMYASEYKTKYEVETNKTVKLVDCPYFTTNIIEFDNEIDKDYNDLDSFVIFMALGGDFEVVTEGGTEDVAMGETILIPACLESVQLKPKSEKVKVLEVYIS